jgi:hypothetical protein
VSALRTRDARTDEWCAPIVPADETLVFDEPGRVLVLKPRGNYDVDYRSHYLRVTKGEFGGHMLRVRHGAGDESWRLDDTAVAVLRDMDSDARYFLLYAIMRANTDSARAARDATTREWRQATAEGRVRRRKVRGQSAYRVSIEPARAGVPQ